MNGLKEGLKGSKGIIRPKRVKETRSIVGLSQRGGRLDRPRINKRPTKLRIEKWGSGVGNKPF